MARSKLTRQIFLNTTLSSLALLTASYVIAAPALEEVLVTAQKRSESAQDIPIAVTGVSADMLDKLGFRNANDVSAQVPNMQVSGPYGDVQPIFSIRGVSMSDYSSNQASPIGVYVDEAYLGPYIATVLTSSISNVSKYCVNHKGRYTGKTPQVAQSILLLAPPDLAAKAARTSKAVSGATTPPHSRPAPRPY